MRKKLGDRSSGVRAARLRCEALSAKAQAGHVPDSPTPGRSGALLDRRVSTSTRQRGAKENRKCDVVGWEVGGGKNLGLWWGREVQQRFKHQCRGACLQRLLATQAGPARRLHEFRLQISPGRLAGITWCGTSAAGTSGRHLVALPLLLASCTPLTDPLSNPSHKSHSQRKWRKTRELPLLQV